MTVCWLGLPIHNVYNFERSFSKKLNFCLEFNGFGAFNSSPGVAICPEFGIEALRPLRYSIGSVSLRQCKLL